MLSNISDAYIIDFILQETIKNSVVWEQGDGGEFYLKNIKGVSVRLMLRERTASSICFLFKYEAKEAWILEPDITNTFALFGRKYKTEPEAHLAQSMRQLVKAIRSQHFSNGLRNREEAEEVKKEVFNQFLFGRGEE